MGPLQNHSPFPSIAVPRVGGGMLRLPDDLAGTFGVVLFYRGAWCPYCTTQLSAFGRAHDALREAGIEVVALSVDDEATSAALAAQRRLPFAVGHSAEADVVASATGAYVNQEPHHLQSTGFVLDPDGRVVTAVYSSGAIGRLMPDDVLGLVRYLMQHA